MMIPLGTYTTPSRRTGFGSQPRGPHGIQERERDRCAGAAKQSAP